MKKLFSLILMVMLSVSISMAAVEYDKQIDKSMGLICTMYTQICRQTILLMQMQC